MKISYINDEFFSRLESLAVNFSPDLKGYFGGKHRTRSYGQTVEFADYREYMLGDDIRRIDWNLYSRFEKHYLKLFTDERQMHTQIFVDCSASMGKASQQKSAYAIGVAAALGYLSVHNMDKVSYKLMMDGKTEDPTGVIVGKTTFFKAIGELEKVDFNGESNIADAVMNNQTGGNADGLTIIISDFFSEPEAWKKAVNYLAYKRRQIMLIQIVTPEEREPVYEGRTSLIDSEAVDISDFKNLRLNITRSEQKAYETAFRELMDDLKTFCVSRGADFIMATSDKPIEQMIFGELFKTGMIG